MTYNLPEEYPLATTNIEALRLIHKGVDLCRPAIVKRGVLSLGIIAYNEGDYRSALKQASFFLPDYKNPLIKPLRMFKTNYLFDETFGNFANESLTDYKRRVIGVMPKGIHFESADVGLLLFNPEMRDVMGIHQQRMANFMAYTTALMGKKEREECHNIAKKISPYDIPQVEVFSVLNKKQSEEEEQKKQSLELLVSSA